MIFLFRTTADDIVEETRPLKKRGRKPGTVCLYGIVPAKCLTISL